MRSRPQSGHTDNEALPRDSGHAHLFWVSGSSTSSHAGNLPKLFWEPSRVRPQSSYPHRPPGISAQECTRDKSQPPAIPKPRSVVPVRRAAAVLALNRLSPELPSDERDFQRRVLNWPSAAATDNCRLRTNLCPSFQKNFGGFNFSVSRNRATWGNVATRKVVSRDAITVCAENNPSHAKAWPSRHRNRNKKQSPLIARYCRFIARAILQIRPFVQSFVRLSRPV